MAPLLRDLSSQACLEYSGNPPAERSTLIGNLRADRNRCSPSTFYYSNGVHLIVYIENSGLSAAK